jgi:hypothetical protein
VVRGPQFDKRCTTLTVLITLKVSISFIVSVACGKRFSGSWLYLCNDSLQIKKNEYGKKLC